MIAPALVDGRRFSRPDLDRSWAAFVEYGISPVFHIAAFPFPFDDAWSDPDRVNPVLGSVFIGTTPALPLVG